MGNDLGGCGKDPLPTSNSLIRAPSTSMLSNRSVYSVNKPNNNSKSSPATASSTTASSSRQLPQPNQRNHPNSKMYNFQPAAVLPQPPSPRKSPSSSGGVNSLAPLHHNQHQHKNGGGGPSSSK